MNYLNHPKYAYLLASLSIGLLIVYRFLSWGGGDTGYYFFRFFSGFNEMQTLSYWKFALMPICAIIILLLSLWAAFSPKANHRILQGITAFSIAGILSLGFFVNYYRPFLSDDDYGISFIGIGFWLALVMLVTCTFIAFQQLNREIGQPQK